MSFVLVPIVAFGFSHTVPDDFSTPGFPPLLAVRGAVFSAWMLLFVAQPALVATGKTGVHRKLGWLGLVIAVAMVGLGGYAPLFGLWSGEIPPFYPHGLFLIRGAIANRRKSEWHRRLLLCATIVVNATRARAVATVAGLRCGTTVRRRRHRYTILLLGPAADLIARRRVHPAYVSGVGAVVLGQIATDLLAIATALLHALATR